MTAMPSDSPVLPNLLSTCGNALATAQKLSAAAKDGVTALVSRDGKINADLLEQHQFAAHGFAWFATTVAALEQMLAWAKRLEESRRFGELEQLMLQAAFGEYLNQLYGGLPMSQGEVVRLSDFGSDSSTRHGLHCADISVLRESGHSEAVRSRIGALIHDYHFGDPAIDDETLVLVRDQFRKFADSEVIPHAHEWHLKDELIPLEIVEHMAELGVFGLTIPEEYGGLGMGKMAMCVVTEELSRGYIGVGSLGTRSEIAGELIRLGGTEEQNHELLPKCWWGEILQSAVFT